MFHCQPSLRGKNTEQQQLVDFCQHISDFNLSTLMTPAETDMDVNASLSWNHPFLQSPLS